MQRNRLVPWLWILCLALLVPAAAPAPCAEPVPAVQAGGASQRPVRVLVAYHSRRGNTEKMAQGVLDGVKRVPGVTALLKKIPDVTQADLESADALILGVPTYYANIPGTTKTVLDDWAWKMKVDFTDKIGGAFSTGGGQTGGKEHVVTSLLLYMLSNRMIVAGPLYEDEAKGDLWGEPGSSAMTGPLDFGVSPQELDAALRLGERIARLTRKAKGP